MANISVRAKPAAGLDGVSEDHTSAPAAGHRPIDVVIGTKAQYIKTAPFLRELSRRGAPYRLIDTGQHAGLTPELRSTLGVDEPAAVLSEKGNISTIRSAALWAAKITLDCIFRPKLVKQRYFSPDSEYCVIHGDTPSTLLSLLLAKRAGKKVAHLEAGLRSHNYFKPFPEELIRIICMRFADVLFSPSLSATKNIERMKIGGEVIQLPQNTNVEALYHALGNEDDFQRGHFAVITVHRVETIFSRQRLEFVIKWIRRIAETRPVVFVMHDPTRIRLDAYGLREALDSHPNVDVRPLMSHSEFAKLLAGAGFVMTDGGSIQEETFFLDTPCFVMRTETERDEGLGGNVVIGGFEDESVQSFLATFPSMRRGYREDNKHPSALIADTLLSSSS